MEIKPVASIWVRIGFDSPLKSSPASIIALFIVVPRDGITAGPTTGCQANADQSRARDRRSKVEDQHFTPGIAGNDQPIEFRVGTS